MPLPSRRLGELLFCPRGVAFFSSHQRIVHVFIEEAVDNVTVSPPLGVAMQKAQLGPDHQTNSCSSLTVEISVQELFV